ncbi:disaggregatase related repeat-containing protein [Methanosarcina sp. T3]|uniref:disaggregatase related repeat-containing protein n=1 Tax=Methanosarcina sp. T3 TaxID=3439062 RepID=UPI003F87BE51
MYNNRLREISPEDVFRGSTLYTAFTHKGSTLPDNRYYGLGITDLVKEYVS